MNILFKILVEYPGPSNDDIKTHESIFNDFPSKSRFLESNKKHSDFDNLEKVVTKAHWIELMPEYRQKNKSIVVENYNITCETIEV